MPGGVAVGQEPNDRADAMNDAAPPADAVTSPIRAPASPAPAGADAAPRGRSFALVLNDRAGALLAAGTQDAAARLAGSLAASGLALHDVPHGTLVERIRAAAATADVVVVGGGDGSIACAAQCLAGSDRVLAILPAGTMNLLARDLRLPVGDLDAAAELLVSGAVRRIDLGEVAGQVFTCACMLGTPARIGHHRELARRRGSGPLAWLRVARAAWRAARRDRALHLILRIDGREMRVRTPSLTITVNALDDTTGRAFGRSVLDGGRLCAYVLARRRPWDLARLAWHLATGTVRDPALRRLDGQSIEVRARGAAGSAALRVLIDGEEHLLAPPLRFTLRAQVLGVIAPSS